MEAHGNVIGVVIIVAVLGSGEQVMPQCLVTLEVGVGSVNYLAKGIAPLVKDNLFNCALMLP